MDVRHYKRHHQMAALQYGTFWPLILGGRCVFIYVND